MNIVVYGRLIDDSTLIIISQLSAQIQSQKCKVLIYSELYERLEELNSEGRLSSEFHIEELSLFSTHDDLKRSPSEIDLFVSVGGDGTFLSCVEFIRDLDIPMIGINTGRLGFLAEVAVSDFSGMLEQFIAGDYSIEERLLLEVRAIGCDEFNLYPYALNDFTIHKQDSSQVIEIETYIDGSYVSTFRADGLILATPTGSTAYSLSVGGPVLVPNSSSIVVNAIAPHQLTVRPIVVSSTSEIRMRVSGRGKRCMISIDSRSIPVSMDSEFLVKEAPFKMKLVKLSSSSFYSTLRHKLMWGADNREPFKR